MLGFKIQGVYFRNPGCEGARLFARGLDVDHLANRAGARPPHRFKGLGFREGSNINPNHQSKPSKEVYSLLKNPKA